MNFCKTFVVSTLGDRRSPRQFWHVYNGPNVGGGPSFPQTKANNQPSMRHMMSWSPNNSGLCEPVSGLMPGWRLNAGQHCGPLWSRSVWHRGNRSSAMGLSNTEQAKGIIQQERKKNQKKPTWQKIAYLPVNPASPKPQDSISSLLFKNCIVFFIFHIYYRHPLHRTQQFVRR